MENNSSLRLFSDYAGLRAEREWKDVEELVMVLEEVILAYNDAPHQGLDGLSPDEYGRRLKCVWHQVDYNKISPFKRDHTRKIVITVKIRKEEIRVGKVQKGAMREFIFVMPQKV